MTSTNLFISPKKILHRVTDYAGNTSDLYTPNASNDFKMCAQNPQAIKMWSILQYLVCGNMDFKHITAEDSNGKVSKTIRLIKQDKKCTWICEIKLTFVPSCAQMRLQLLHFHAVFKTWPTFQKLERPLLRLGGDAGVKVISAKIETYRVTNKI